MEDILAKTEKPNKIIKVFCNFQKSFPQATLQANKFFPYLLSLILKE